MSAKQQVENSAGKHAPLRINGALLDAARRDDAESVRAILADPEEDASNPGMTGQTPLHIAASNDSVNAIDALVDLGADIDAQDVNGDTPLCVAAAGKHDNAARLLLAHGANPDTNDHFGYSPLHHAIKRGDAKMVAVLIDGGADPDHRTVSTSGHENADEMAARYGEENILDMLRDFHALRHANRIKTLRLRISKGMRP